MTMSNSSRSSSSISNNNLRGRTRLCRNEEKKEESPSSPSDDCDNHYKTTTTVVTCTSSNAHGGGGAGGGDGGGYTALCDMLPCSVSSPTTSLTDTTEVSLSSSLPIPVPTAEQLKEMERKQGNDADGLGSSADVVLTYYRIAYRGVVALLSEPRRNAPRSGAYLSYGEVFATTEPPILTATTTPRRTTTSTSSILSPQHVSRTTSSSSPPCLPLLPQIIRSSRDSKDDILAGETASAPSAADEVVSVMYVLTGGYAAASETISSIFSSTGPRSCLGYLCTHTTLESSSLSSSSGSSTPTSRIFERLDSPPPRVQAASLLPWTYQIVSTSPVPILTGPCLDAPRTAAMLLPGTRHEISLRVNLNTNNEQGEEDQQELLFLRLQHRRGWICAWNQTKHGAIIPVAQEVISATAMPPPPPRPNQNSAPSSPASTSVLYSLGGDVSVASSSSASHAATTTTNTSLSLSYHAYMMEQQPRMRRRRHRPPRRAMLREHDVDNSFVSSSTASSSSLLPPPAAVGPPPLRQVGGNTSMMMSSQLLLPTSSVAVSTNKPQQTQLDEKCSVSMVSDDDDDHNENNNHHNHEQHEELSQQSSSFSSSQHRSHHSSSHHHHLSETTPPTTEVVFLMRVTSPHGLKILDAPQYAVSHLIHGGLAAGSDHRHHPKKAFSTLPQSMLSCNPATNSSNTTSAVVFDAHSKSRKLPPGVYFETTGATSTTSTSQQQLLSSYAGGGGQQQQETTLLQLLDKTGWAIVPAPADVETLAVAQTVVVQSSNRYNIGNNNQWEWIRVLVRSGLAPVACPPTTSSTATSSLTSLSVAAGASSAPHSPSSIRTGVDSDVSSSVSSALFDVFRTPSKKKPQPTRAATAMEGMAIIPCGTFVQVEKTLSGEYARLRGGQGWIPTSVRDKPVCARLSNAIPEYRFGSFWFRVQDPRGIKVRVGPSRRAPSIKSSSTTGAIDNHHDNGGGGGVYFRFECGEFLRASEIVTVLLDEEAKSASEPNPDNFSSSAASAPVAECFCKLYRNRHAQMQQELFSRDSSSSSTTFRPLESYTMPAEWVQVYHGEQLYLEECAQEPRIERHKQGWKYHVVQPQVSVRRGPSFAAESIGILEEGDAVLINERVAPALDKLQWLRLKEGHGWTGWVHDTCQETGEALVVPHSLLRQQQSKSSKQNRIKGNSGKEEIAYNTIIARLFHNDDPQQQQQHHQRGGNSQSNLRR